MQIEEKYSSKLLVEGSDDQHVIWSICARYNIPESFDIIDCRNIHNLLEQIGPRLKTANINSLGLILDADQDISSRWNSVRDRLRQYGYVLPRDFPESGLVLESNNGLPVVGVWLMPDNQQAGMLEDFIKLLIPYQSPLKEYIDTILTDLEEKKYNRYNLEIHRQKAFIHTYLAWQEDPGTRMGSAITKKYLDIEAPNCQVFVNWLQKTFNN